MSNLDWMDLAACVGHPNPDLFFPSETGHAGRIQAAEAALVCRECPVGLQCQEHKARTGAASGVWAGGIHRTQALGRSPGGPRGGQAHGTDARYKQHHRDGEPPCTACRAAHSAKGAPNGRSKTRWTA